MAWELGAFGDGSCGLLTLHADSKARSRFVAQRGRVAAEAGPLSGARGWIDAGLAVTSLGVVYMNWGLKAA